MLKPYWELAKPRIVLMVLITTTIGYRLAGGRDWTLLGWTLLATALCAAASGTINQFIEIRRDGMMTRTRSRPLPQGRVGPGAALVFGLVCAELSLALYFWKVNALTATLAALSLGLYVLFYTPLKPLTPNSTWPGAAAGAIPPMIGWAAARGELTAGAWILFGIQFFWQIPHFLAIFWLYREEYAKAGYRVLPVLDPKGERTAIQISLHSMALLACSVLPVSLGMAGFGYGVGALILGTIFLAFGVRVGLTLRALDARRLFFASIVYLPAVFCLLLVG